MRHVGEPIAMVVAESRYVAEDALDDIVVELRAAAGGGGSRGARSRRDAPSVHDDLGSNLAAHVRQTKGDYARGRGAAPHLSSRRRFRYDRGASAPIETRGVVAQWDARAEQLTIWDTTQAPVSIRNGLAADARPAASRRCASSRRSSAAASAPRS